MPVTDVRPFLEGDWTTLLAEDDGAAVGLAVVQRRLRIGYAGHELWLAEMVVDERSRRRGIGRALVAAVEEHASATGCRLVRLESRAARRDAHAFYRALGYTDHGVSFTKAL